MRVVLLPEPRTYDGLQLSTAFVDECCPDSAADVAVLFQGVADVPLEHMVDTDDVEAGRPIYSPWMAHLVVEHRDVPLDEAAWRQRLLARLAAEWVQERSGVGVTVRGDDLYVGDGKLSVSVATSSPRSSLIHLGLNVETEGTPVRTSGLRDLHLPADELLRGVARRYADELDAVRHAIHKVRAVR